MRVFITGATGVIGRALVNELVVYGHDVVGLARTDASRSLLRAMRASALSGQGRDVEQLADAMCDVHAAVHLAKTIPTDDSATEDKWAQNEEVMVSMLRNLLKASEACGVRTIVFPSFYGVYGDCGDAWVDEESPVASEDPVAEPHLRAEQMLLESTAMRRSAGVVLRLGLIYAPDAAPTRGMIYGLKRGQAPLIGNGNMYWPMLHAADAARAIRLALEHSPAGAIFNVCDDEPIRHGRLYMELAQWLGGPPPISVGTGELARFGTGELNPYYGQVRTSALRHSVRMSNQRIKEQLGLKLQYPTYREGFRAVIDAMGET